MSTPINSRKALLRHFESLPEELKGHFDQLGSLIDSSFPLDVCLAYAFYRVELAHRDTLYCGSVKHHHIDAGLARKTVQQQHLTREKFRAIFKNLFLKPLPDTIVKTLQTAEDIRDQAMHGSEPTEAEVRAAIANVLDYSKNFNGYVKSIGGFAPFGNLQGFHGGRAKRLSTATTRLVLKGLAFDLS